MPCCFLIFSLHDSSFELTLGQEHILITWIVVVPVMVGSPVISASQTYRSPVMAVSIFSLRLFVSEFDVMSCLTLEPAAILYHLIVTSSSGLKKRHYTNSKI